MWMVCAMEYPLNLVQLLQNTTILTHPLTQNHSSPHFYYISTIFTIELFLYTVIIPQWTYCRTMLGSVSWSRTVGHVGHVGLGIDLPAFQVEDCLLYPLRLNLVAVVWIIMQCFYSIFAWNWKVTFWFLNNLWMLSSHLINIIVAAIEIILVEKSLLVLSF